MNRLVRSNFWILFLVCSLFVPAVSSAQTTASKREIIRQAKKAYYNLRNEGLVEFQCSITPNWGALLADLRKTDPAAADAAFKDLQQLQFSLSLGPNGVVNVTHNTVTPPNDQVAKGFNQITSGMEQMVTGFFQTASPFLLTSPVPEVDSDYQLEEQTAQYRLSYREGTADVLTTMGKDFAITTLSVTTPEFTSSIRPQFTKIAKGLLLTGYAADYRSKSPGEATRLSVQIDYREADGLQLPHKLNLGGTYGGTSFAVEVTLSGCQVKKR